LNFLIIKIEIGGNVMKRNHCMIMIIMTMIVLGYLSYAPYVGATSANISWNGWVMATGNINEGYSYKITNMTIADNGSIYTAVLWLSVSRCTNLNISCPMTKRVTFMVKKSTNTFILGGKPAFFAFYWPNYTLSRSFYNLGNELKPSITEVYLNNESKKNYVGKGIDLIGHPRRIETCTGVSPPPNLTCLETETQNFTPDLIFKGPYPIFVQIYYNSDPFGVIKNRSVTLVENVINSPQTKEFLRSVPDVSENSPVKVYLAIAGAVVLAGLIIWRLKR